MGLPSNNPVPIVKRPRRDQPLDHRWGAGVADAIRVLTERGIPTPRTAATAGATTCVAWKPNIRNAGAVGVPDWKVYLSFGTVNGVAPSNWDTEISINAATDYWPTLTCTTSDGEITAITTSMETSAPSSDAVASGAPPTSFAITLGMISDLVPCMLYTTNLTATAQEIFKKSRASLSFSGQEPFERFFRWAISAG